MYSTSDADVVDVATEPKRKTIGPFRVPQILAICILYINIIKYGYYTDLYYVYCNINIRYHMYILYSIHIL